jgi:hypothetical protein
MLDLTTVGALKDNPGALDLYCWQAHRSWEFHRQKLPSLPVPVFGPEGLLVQLGGMADAEEEGLRRLRANQALVQAAWAGCPNHFTEDGRFLVLGPCEATGKPRPPLPGVSAASPTPHLTVVRPSTPPRADKG